MGLFDGIGTPGTWGTWYGIAGPKLPDFQLTEALASRGTIPSNSTTVNPQVINPTGTQYGPTFPTNNQVLGDKTTNNDQNTGGSTGLWGTTRSPADTTPSTPGDSRLVQLEKIGDAMNPSEREEYDRLRAQADPYAGLRSQINSGWDQYTNQLNDMLNVGLPGQRSAQEGIASTAYNQGINDLSSQKASSEQAVTKQQATSLKDLGENVRNLFQSGNIYLGARGAGDSSAANQYSYAISKMGTKARGDIMTQANDRINQINDIFNSESNRLKSDYQTKLGSIANWFNEAQNSIRSQIGQAGLGRSQDLQALSQNIYNQALQAMQTLQAETANRRSMLETWAANNSKTVGELVRNMQTVQQMPGYSGITSGMPQVTSEGNMYVPTGYGAQGNTKDKLFGNIIR